MTRTKRRIFAILATCLSGAWAQGGEARRLTLDDMYRLASTNNRRLALLAAGIETAESGTRLIEAARLPRIVASVSASYLGDARIVDRDFGGASRVSTPHFGNSFALEASQILYAGGAISGGIEKARLEETMARLVHQKGGQSIRFLLASLYLDLWKLGNQRAVYAGNLEREEILVGQMGARFQAGTALKSDLLRHELMLQNMKLALIRLDDSRRILNNQLVAMLGLPETDRVEPDTTILGVHRKDPSANELERRAKSDLPELKLAEIGMQVARKDVEISRAGRMPTVALFAGDKFDGPITFEVPAIDKNINAWFVGVDLKYEISSLYNSGRSVRLARSKEAAAIRARDLAREQAELAIKNGVIGFRQSMDELAVLEKGCEVARENHAVVTERYKSGVALVTEMMDAGNSLLDAELKLVDGRINTIFQSLNLERVSGGI